MTTTVAQQAARAMSCDAQVLVVADHPGPLLDHAIRRLDELERRWSRFLADSEVSGLNRAGGAPRRCSRDTITLIEESVRAWHATRGAYDPTLLGALVELGYAASRTDATQRTSLTPAAGWRGHPDAIRIDAGSGVVVLPPGTTLDPGGIGKGLAADLIVAELVELGAEGALVEIGGDLRVAGDSPASDHWLVDIAPDPTAERVHIALAAGGVATSSSRLRTWTAAAGERHHLIDPGTLSPTDADVIACTVIAGTAAWAEAFTKVAFVNGCAAALDEYEHRGLAARVTTDNRTTHHTSAWEAFRR